MIKWLCCAYYPKGLVWQVDPPTRSSCRLLARCDGCCDQDWQPVTRRVACGALSRRHRPGVRYNAIISGDVELTTCLLDRGYTINNNSRDVYDAAAQSGNLEMLMWVRAHLLARDTHSEVLATAAARRQFDIIQWTHANIPDGVSTTNVLDFAATKGHVEILQWLHDKRPYSCSTGALDSVAKNGRLEIVKWLQAYRTEGCTTRAMDGAENRLIDVLDWMFVNRTEGCSEDAVFIEARFDHLEVLKWVHEHGFVEFQVDTMYWATRTNAWTWSNGCWRLAPRAAILGP